MKISIQSKKVIFSVALIITSLLSCVSVYAGDETNTVEPRTPEAMYNLGLRYYNGEGLEKNPYAAVRWFREAAELGNSHAMNSLGDCYDNGDGVEKNFTEAVKWYRKAAELGNSKAMYNLGLCYHSGEGVARNFTEAAKWLRKAAELGNEDANRFLRKIEKK